MMHATYSAVLKSFESAPVLQEAAGLMVVELLLPKAPFSRPLGDLELTAVLQKGLKAGLLSKPV